MFLLKIINFLYVYYIFLYVYYIFHKKIFKKIPIENLKKKLFEIFFCNEKKTNKKLYPIN